MIEIRKETFFKICPKELCPNSVLIRLILGLLLKDLFQVNTDLHLISLCSGSSSNRDATHTPW